MLARLCPQDTKPQLLLYVVTQCSDTLSLVFNSFKLLSDLSNIGLDKIFILLFIRFGEKLLKFKIDSKSLQF